MQFAVNYKLNDRAFISFRFSFTNKLTIPETSRLQFISIVEARRLPKWYLHCFLHTNFLALLAQRAAQRKGKQTHHVRAWILYTFVDWCLTCKDGFMSAIVVNNVRRRCLCMDSLRNGSLITELSKAPSKRASVVLAPTFRLHRPNERVR